MFSIMTIFLQFVAPICLPERDSPGSDKYKDDLAHLVGWGSSNPFAKLSDKLQLATVQVFSERLVMLLKYSKFWEWDKFIN